MTPFEILGLPEDTDDDAQVKQAYLAKVRAHPPEHAPQQFQRIREAYEHVQDHHKRLTYKLLHIQAVSRADIEEPLLSQRGELRRPDIKIFRQALFAALSFPVQPK